MWQPTPVFHVVFCRSTSANSGLQFGASFFKCTSEPFLMLWVSLHLEKGTAWRYWRVKVAEAALNLRRLGGSGYVLPPPMLRVVRSVECCVHVFRSPEGIELSHWCILVFFSTFVVLLSQFPYFCFMISLLKLLVPSSLSQSLLCGGCAF
jgi:hypothetical protein